MPSRLPASVKRAVFFRSLFLQASWNPRTMQGLGFAYALYPALRWLYPAPEDLKKALGRHLGFFNTQPYMAAAVLGGVLFHEERIARKEDAPEKVIAFKNALMGPLAAVGDGFFWLSLRPTVAALSVACVPLLGAYSALLFLVLYNVVHLGLRVRLFLWGVGLGEGLVEPLSRANLAQRGNRARMWAAALLGATFVYWAWR